MALNRKLPGQFKMVLGHASNKVVGTIILKKRKNVSKVSPIWH